MPDSDSVFRKKWERGQKNDLFGPVVVYHYDGLILILLRLIHRPDDGGSTYL
jgi:hypothetical protein